MVRRLATKAQKTDGGNLMRAKAWVFGFEIDDQLAHIRREGSRLIRRRSTVFVEQACHALLIKLVYLMVQRAFAGSGFSGAFRSGFAEQHNRTKSVPGTTPPA